MDLVFSIIKVIFGSFGLFLISKHYLLKLENEKKWNYLNGILVFLIMFGYKLIDGGISVPSYTVLVFGVVIAGFLGQFGFEVKGAVKAISIGFGLGWLTHLDILTLKNFQLLSFN